MFSMLKSLIELLKKSNILKFVVILLTKDGYSKFINITKVKTIIEIKNMDNGQYY